MKNEHLDTCRKLYRNEKQKFEAAAETHDQALEIVENQQSKYE